MGPIGGQFGASGWLFGTIKGDGFNATSVKFFFSDSSCKHWVGPFVQGSVTIYNA